MAFEDGLRRGNLDSCPSVRFLGGRRHRAARLSGLSGAPVQSWRSCRVGTGSCGFCDRSCKSCALFSAILPRVVGGGRAALRSGRAACRGGATSPNGRTVLHPQASCPSEGRSPLPVASALGRATRAKPPLRPPPPGVTAVGSRLPPVSRSRPHLARAWPSVVDYEQRLLADPCARAWHHRSRQDLLDPWTRAKASCGLHWRMDNEGADGPPAVAPGATGG